MSKREANVAESFDFFRYRYKAVSGYSDKSDIRSLLGGINKLIKDCSAAGEMELHVRSLTLYALTLSKLGRIECALKLVARASDIANDNGLIYARINADKSGAILYLQLSELETAKAIAFQSLSEARNHKFTDLEADTLSLLGHVFEIEENYNRAIAYFYKSRQIAKSAQHLELEVAALCDLGRILGARGDFIKSLEYLEEALRIVDCPCPALYIPLINNLIADVYRSLGDLDLAVKYLNEALSSSRIWNTPDVAVSIKSRIGRLRLDEQEYEEALEHFEHIDAETKRAHFIIDNWNNSVAIAGSLIGMKSYGKAKEVLVRIIRNVQHYPAGNHDLICQVLEQLSIVYSQLGYPSESQRLMDYSMRFKDSQETGMYDSHQQKLVRQSLYSTFANDISEIIDKEITNFEIRGRTIKFAQGIAFVTFSDSDEKVKLTPTQSKFLRFLKLKQGSPVSVLRLAQEVYPGADDDSPKDWQVALKPFMSQIRKKLKDDDQSIIVPVTHEGWMLAES